MKTGTYKWILYTIVIVIIATIGIQIYWNYTNYLNNKKQLVNEVQISLDKAVDAYYTQIAEETTLGLSLEGESQKTILDEGGLLDQISNKIDTNNSTFAGLDSLNVSDIKGITVFKGLSADSLLKAPKNEKDEVSLKATIEGTNQKTPRINPKGSGIITKDFEFLTSKIVISITIDTLQTSVLDSLFLGELNRKDIQIDYQVHFYTNKERLAFFKENRKMPEEDIRERLNDKLMTESKSTFLPKNSVLAITFSNSTKTIFSRIFGGILISLLLILAVISSLFYLLKIIKSQKQLSDIKNDLISNITHEFKTPIATIGAALESIQNFNVINDKEKTKSYLAMSGQQLEKLNFMVEKLLETASLDSNNLNLDKEPIDLVYLLSSIKIRFEGQSPEKKFHCQSNSPSVVAQIDVFHFENAINNVLDNAVKYGGNDIFIHLHTTRQKITISIADNGRGIPKENQHLIFDKFYRVPKGNTHDVKGFGIGLYYTKTIINKHGGDINLNTKDGKTIFKIQLDHGKD